MNQFVPAEYSERLVQLALGLEPLDAALRFRLAQRLDVMVDGVPSPLPRSRRPRGFGGFEVPDGRERLPRHETCVHVFLRRPGLKSPLKVRCQDATRRFVPRRLSVPIAASAPTVIRPAFFPGAAYDASPRATGLRGLSLRGGKPLRWARVEARLPAVAPGTGPVVGRAHGDDRGEFLLLLEPAASTIAALVDPLQVEVTVFGPLIAPVPAHPSLPREDPLWDLPLEDVPAAPPDNVSPGIALPPGYGATPTSRTVVPFPLGKLSSAVPPFVFS